MQARTAKEHPLPHTEAELLACARAGMESAVRALIQRNNRRLFRVARAVLRSDAEAEDVVQETYVKAFTGLSAFRGEAAFSSWLTRIALNEACGRLRKSRPTVDISDLENINGASVIMFPGTLAPPGAEAELGRTEVRAMLEAAIDALPLGFRTVLILRDVEGMSVAETAAQLELNAQTVKTRLHRARTLVRRRLEKQLSAGFSDLYPFDGMRCVNMADRVLERLRRTEDN